MGIHRGEVSRCENGPQTPGITAEYPHTGSTSATDPGIQNSTNQIPLQGNLSCSRTEDVHSRCTLETPSSRSNEEITAYVDYGSTRRGSNQQLPDQSVLIRGMA